MIEVSDTGLGVPPEALPHIFDRWARADGARTRERGGAGLGLAIVAAVTRGHGGRCSVKRLPRVGVPAPPACADFPETASGPAPASEGEITGVEPALSESGVALD